jgi:hypothetical protein
MLKARDGVEEIPPLPKDDASSGKATPIDGASRESRVEQLSFELKQLKLQRKIDKLKTKLKDFKSRELTSSSLSNEEIDASSEEAKGKRGRKGDKKSYNTTSFNYDNLPPSSAFTSVLDEDASNLSQSERLGYCAYMC